MIGTHKHAADLKQYSALQAGENMINQKHATSFDKVASTYDKGRIGYPEKLYKTIDLYTHLNSNSTILEVGCGNGIATQEIFNIWNSNIIAIDPGKSLLEIAGSKLANNKIQYVNIEYENFNSVESVDAIFSATAFHWIDQKIKYKKSYEILRNDGFLVLYWNNYVIENKKTFSDIQKIYNQYHPDGKPDKDVRQIQSDKIEYRKKEIDNSKFFNLMVHHEYIHSIIMRSEEYINLLKSFSNNSSLLQEELSRFYNEIYNYIHSANDRISVQINVNLEIAKKCVAVSE